MATIVSKPLLIICTSEWAVKFFFQRAYTNALTGKNDRFVRPSAIWSQLCFKNCLIGLAKAQWLWWFLHLEHKGCLRVSESQCLQVQATQTATRRHTSEKTHINICLQVYLLACLANLSLANVCGFWLPCNGGFKGLVSSIHQCESMDGCQKRGWQHARKSPS